MSKSTKKTKAPVETKPAPEKGSWQEELAKSTALQQKSDKDRNRASALLWDGAVRGIESWLGNAATDPSAEEFGREVTEALGKGRKGDASKIKSVALAVKNNGLALNDFPNLSKAYAEARRLTKVVVEQSEEDAAAEEIISNIDAPKTASTAEGAAKIVLAKGVDEAARLLLDALGDTAHDAHRSLLRALSQEVTGRAKAAKEAERAAKVASVKDEPKAKAKQASTTKAAPKPTATKAKAKPKGKPAEVAAAEVDDADVEVVSTPVEDTLPDTETKAKPKVKPSVKVKPKIKK